jgi:hypothetical protein
VKKHGIIDKDWGLAITVFPGLTAFWILTPGPNYEEG